MRIDKQQLIKILKTKDKRIIHRLWEDADRIRKKHVGDAVHLRGIIEISNFCIRQCTYCGIRGARKSLHRYRMGKREIYQCVRKIEGLGYGTVVLQAGEDPSITPDDIISIVQWIKKHTHLAITLSLGEHEERVFKSWKRAGADRYLLKIETTNDMLLKKIHPGEPFGTRKENLLRLKKLGYEVGTGIMIGLPGQTFSMVADDLRWFQKMDFDMIGIGPYIPHPETPLSMEKPAFKEQVSSDEFMVNKVIALTRLLCPQSNIPATTALATINLKSGRENALFHGANVVMPNVTPPAYRPYYEIYPGKACIKESEIQCFHCITARIKKIGRTIGKGPGTRLHSA